MAQLLSFLHAHALHVALAFILGAGPTTAIMLHGDPFVDDKGNAYTGRCTEEAYRSKDIDFVVYGATGFVGQLAVEYLSRGHPDNPHWAMAGRDKGKLDSVFFQNQQNSTTACSESIVVELNDVEKLFTMAKRAKTILSFAGPYEPIGGEELIRAAVNGCAHYVDIATETPWKAHILKKFGSIAKTRGVAIVQSAGFYSMAADMLAVSAVQDLHRLGKTAAEVMVVWTRINGHFTGSELASERARLSKYGPITDPYILAPGALEKHDLEPDGFSSVYNRGKNYGFEPRLNMVLLPLDNAKTDCAVIRRSMSRKFKGWPIKVREAKNVSMDIEQRLFMKYPGKQKNSLPGQGPMKWLRQVGSANGFAIASTSETDLPGVMVSMDLHGDPSTVASPVMAVEVALSLSKNGPPNSEGGYLTPATAVKLKDFESRLARLYQGAFMNISHYVTNES